MPRQQQLLLMRSPTPIRVQPAALLFRSSNTAQRGSILLCNDFTMRREITRKPTLIKEQKLQRE